jgi:hypothetical protein
MTQHKMTMPHGVWLRGLDSMFFNILDKKSNLFEKNTLQK